MDFRKIGFCSVVCLLLASVGARADANLTKLTDWETKELNQRIKDFYANPTDPKQMDTPIPKADALTGELEEDDPSLVVGTNGSTDPLLKAAGFKADPRFIKFQREYRAKHFPKPEVPANATIEDDDKVQNLVKTWTTEKADRDLNSVPTSGESSMDFGRMIIGVQNGDRPHIAIRMGSNFKTYKEALKAYRQPHEYNDLMDDSGTEKAAKTVVKWSPAEKYDLSVGDTDFTLTNQQKNIGKADMDDKGDVEKWMGICDGWAAAAIMVPKAKKPVDLAGADDVPIHWYPDDIRAMASLTWANTNFDSNFIGGRCEAKTPERFPNGRLKQQECFDTNPATLHLALGNMIGRAKLSFIFDSAYNVEVWNQPMKAYDFTYFNPLDPSKRGKEWAKFAVDYNAAFKAKDRFQKPLTRGKWVSDEKWDDSGIKKIVGVIATVAYMDEQDPDANDKPAEDAITRVTYTYDLELHDRDGVLVPLGGEWHRNMHPDFIWIPRKGSVAIDPSEPSDLNFTGDDTPRKKLANNAAETSGNGVPLCHVLRVLVQQSSGADTYSCGDGSDNGALLLR